MPIVPVTQDQSVHSDPRHPGSRPDARWQQPIFRRRRKDLPLYGLLDLRQIHGASRDRARQGNPRAPFDKICYIGCGVTTGVGAVINTAKVEMGATAVVFGLGGIGLNVIQGLRLAGADMIIGVDLNEDKKAWGERFGMTHFVNPSDDRRRYRCPIWST